MEHLHKTEKLENEDALWNIPEQPQGVVNIIGGNLQSFRTPVKTAEFLSTNYPVKTVNTVLPDALKEKLPPLENLLFLSSTDSGSFKDATELKTTMDAADFNLIIGDLSKNSITKTAVADACAEVEKPLLLARDSVDLVAEEANVGNILLKENVIFFASIPGLQKLFHAVYYPKMILMSQSLVQISDALHKFTLSYPAKLITFHNDQILIVENGEMNAVPIEKTVYSPFTLWSGDLAAKILALNLYNPNDFKTATTTAILK